MQPLDLSFLLTLCYILRQQISFSTNYKSFIPHYLKKKIYVTNFHSNLPTPLTYSGWAFSGLFTDGRESKKTPPPLPKICHSYSRMMKFGSYTLAKEDPKNIWITWHTSWVLLTAAFFHRKSARNTDLDCILIHNFNFLKLF